jgi:hypothetical protein
MPGAGLEVGETSVQSLDDRLGDDASEVLEVAGGREERQLRARLRLGRRR